MPPTDHPFAEFVRTLGKGPNMWRDLSFDEAKKAMGMILKDQVDPLQLGAFLLLLRRKSETPEELAGMAAAAREIFAPENQYSENVVDFDWPSYADRHRQQPWFILSAILLADQGHKVLMHGIEGCAEGYAPTRPALEIFGIPQLSSLEDVPGAFEKGSLHYIGLEKFCSPLQKLFELRPFLGVRTAVNTFARDLNPLNAPCQMQGVFHPPYIPLHLETARLLGQKQSMIFKGGGGEVQRNPMKKGRVAWLADDRSEELLWPALSEITTYKWREEDLTPTQLLKMWAGEISLPVPEQAIIGTLAVALKMRNKDASLEALDRQAREIWMSRDKKRFN